MRAAALARIAALAASTWLAHGCTDPSYEDGNLRCAVSASACPEGFHCAADNTCWRDGHDPDLASQSDLAGLDFSGADFATPPDLVSTFDLTTDDSGCTPVNPNGCCGTVVNECGQTIQCTDTCPNQLCGGAGQPNQCGCSSDSRTGVFRLADGQKHCYSIEDSPGNPLSDCINYTIEGTKPKFFVYVGDPPVGMRLLVRCFADPLYFLTFDSVTCDGVPGAVMDSVIGYIVDTQVCGSVPLHRYDTGSSGVFYTTDASEKPAGSTELTPPFFVWTN
ncbi:MAG TPA: hypothetical protein VFF06_05885 [Polyangia bacterium]|nr:hypothetical protein [Polyangia bacterium]